MAVRQACRRCPHMDGRTLNYTKVRSKKKEQRLYGEPHFTTSTDASNPLAVRRFKLWLNSKN